MIRGCGVIYVALAASNHRADSRHKRMCRFYFFYIRGEPPGNGMFLLINKMPASAPVATMLYGTVYMVLIMSKYRVWTPFDHFVQFSWLLRLWRVVDSCMGPAE